MNNFRVMKSEISDIFSIVKLASQDNVFNYLNISNKQNLNDNITDIVNNEDYIKYSIFDKYNKCYELIGFAYIEVVNFKGKDENKFKLAPNIKYGMLSIVVDPKYWGTEVAHLLLETIINNAKEVGIHHVELLVIADNIRAYLFYKKEKFLSMKTYTAGNKTFKQMVRFL